MPSLSPCGSNEPSTPTGGGGDPRQRGSTFTWTDPSAWQDIHGVPDGDDDYDTPGYRDDSDNDSVRGDEEYVTNLSLGMYV